MQGFSLCTHAWCSSMHAGMAFQDADKGRPKALLQRWLSGNFCVITLLGWIVRLPWDCKHYNWMPTVLAATTPGGTPVLLCGRIGIRS